MATDAVNLAQLDRVGAIASRLDSHLALAKSDSDAPDACAEGSAIGHSAIPPPRAVHRRRSTASRWRLPATAQPMWPIHRRGGHRCDRGFGLLQQCRRADRSCRARRRRQPDPGRYCGAELHQALAEAASRRCMRAWSASPAPPTTTVLPPA
ncbi:hypothetical protein [Xanthomonas cassavae]|uniref:hypothetical protein n=1 Tax=Xanthomonas cassavae TaxID=56450 RepID=UPI003CCCBBEE